MRPFFATMILGAAVLGGCAANGGTGDSGTCTPGAERCECVAGDRCLSGLICLSNLCVASGGGEDGGTDTGGPGDSSTGTDGGTDTREGVEDAGPNLDAFFEMDPPPMECREDGTMGPPAMAPGGTPECPDDKNREGCVCETPGEMAPCWPGLRANRNRGICRDGVTTCERNGEFGGRWGECRGMVLPREGATLGADACLCFSRGQWQIDNLSPCFAGYGGSAQRWAVSTIMSGAGIECPEIGTTAPPPMPTSPWSTNRLTVDCEGRFTLCYTLRAGRVETAAETDCVVSEVCTTDWYRERDVPQEFPVLPAWVGADPACATAFAETGGYGEMSVQGLSVECDDISDMGERYVFNRVNYCPLRCNADPPPVGDPECEGCMAGGGGSF